MDIQLETEISASKTALSGLLTGLQKEINWDVQPSKSFLKKCAQISKILDIIQKILCFLSYLYTSHSAQFVSNKLQKMLICKHSVISQAFTFSRLNQTSLFPLHGTTYRVMRYRISSQWLLKTCQFRFNCHETNISLLPLSHCVISYV